MFPPITYIDGRRVASKGAFPGSLAGGWLGAGRGLRSRAAEAEMAVDAARRAFPGCGGARAGRRLPILRRFAEGFAGARRRAPRPWETIVQRLAAVRQPLNRMVPRAASEHLLLCRACVDAARASRSTRPRWSTNVRYDPSGVAVLVTPWIAA